MRAFIALDIEAGIQKAMLGLIDKIKKPGDEVKWVRASAMHLTLKFLGEIPEARIADLSDGLERTVRGRPTFPLRVAGTGTFPSSGRPRVFWAGIDVHPQLMGLQRDLERELAVLGFSEEKRRFHPHLTLGRFKKAPSAATRRELSLHSDTVFGEMKADRVILYHSRLLPAGAEYHRLKEVELT